MKKAAIIERNRRKEMGLDALGVGNIHDELQFDSKEEHADEVGSLCARAIKEAGESLNCKVPFTGKYSIGHNWSETH